MEQEKGSGWWKVKEFEGGFFVNDHGYKHFSDGSKGGSINFCMKLEMKSWEESIEALSNNQIQLKANQPEKVQKILHSFQLESKTLVTSGIKEPLEQPRNICAYLAQKRKIPNNLVSELVREKHIVQDRKKNGLFLCRNSKGEIKGIIKEGTGPQRFKGIRKGSDPSYGFSLRSKSEKLYVTESPVDLLL